VTGEGTSEHELIERARAGDENAFAELVGIHATRVYGALRRFGLDPGEADDVAQEVFVRAWRGLARFEQRAQFSTWLYRIAFNEAQRRLARRGPQAAEADPGKHDEQIAALPE
jgi:RNA polymerase sigma factor (sigma-70 family)